MKIIYGVLCHKNSKILRKMIDMLSKENKIYIHIDLKSNINDFSEYKLYKNVIFIDKRVNVKWGEYSQIKSLLNILEVLSKEDFDYFQVLSGDCLPLKSDKKIKEFLHNNYGKEFIGIDVNFNQKKINDRVKYIYPSWIFDKNCINKNLVIRLKRKIQIRYNIFKKNRYYNILPILYKGSNWFTISKKMVKYINCFIKLNPLYNIAFKNSLCCDEVFFQTIIMNSKFRNRIYKIDTNINDNLMSLRYIDWKTGPEYPKILDEEDFNKINREEYLIGRKFTDTLDLKRYDCFIKKRSD